jgi:hypothetical protein
MKLNFEEFAALGGLMMWNIVEHKIISLRSKLNDWELKSLEREFLEKSKSSKKITALTKSIKSALFVDLCYAITKHRDWLQTPVFAALLVEFLQLDHGLARTDAELLVHDMIEIAIELKIYQPRSICCDDREFLTWAYICAASSSGEESLEAELGLGSTVLTKLRDGIRALEQVDSHIFIPEYDSMLAAIVLELGHECKSIPWAMDFHRLRYALLEANGDGAQTYILEESLPSILSSLISIGLGHHKILQDRPALAEALVRAQLLTIQTSGKKIKSSKHALTDFGAKITATKFSIDSNHALTFETFKSYHSRWQESLIRHSKSIPVSFLMGLVTTHINQLSPSVVDSALSQIFHLDQKLVNGVLVQRILSSAQFAWHKAAVMRALGRIKPSRDLLEVIASELTDDSSPGVRLAAASLLDSWTD